MPHKKIIFFIVLIIVYQFTMGQIDTMDKRKSPAYYEKTKQGEVILKKKKAGWIFNCIDCHQDFQSRTLVREMISDHSFLNYQHIKGEKWCFSCHYLELSKRNKIRMPEGKDVYRGTKDMVKLCRQCHGKITGEWEINIHGKITGSWMTWGNMKVEKKTCGDCHSPHHPRSLQVSPLAGPEHPLKSRKKNEKNE